MIDDGREDYELDNYLKDQILDKYGSIMICTLAMELLLTQIVERIDRETDAMLKEDYISRWETCFTQYNDLLTTIQFIDENWVFNIFGINAIKNDEHQISYIEKLISTLVN
jgi:hypothetical protein